MSAGAATSAPASRAAPSTNGFLEYRGLDWTRVRRTRLYADQRFVYSYPQLVHDLSQRLIIRPLEGRPDQRLLDFRLDVTPARAQRSERTDLYGNHLIELDVTRVRRQITFHATFAVERRLAPPPAVSAHEAQLYARPTLLTAADGRLHEVAQQLRRRARSARDLAGRISDFVSDNLRYAGGLTGVKTTAAQALDLGGGLCQDYTHIALALCRACGLSARYVSGHMLGEGGSHAWLEVLLPGVSGALEAVGFDPTNARAPNLGYTVVAVGCDYADVAPTTGLFRSTGAGVLSYQKRAGLVAVEFEDGEVREVPGY